MQLDAFAATDTGPVRPNNEDRWQLSVDDGLFIIADGMGGSAAGEVAAEIAVETVWEVLSGSSDPEETILAHALNDQSDLLRERMRYGMNQAAQRIRQTVDKTPAYAGMGTTLVVLQLSDNQAHLAHIGDSRAYLYREGKLKRLTRDHTVVQQEIDAGRLTPELARTMPQRKILTKVVGGSGMVDPDTSTRVIQTGDIYILCTDGLTDVFEDHDLAAVIKDTHPDDLAQTLVDQSLARKTADNVTVVVVHVVEA